MLFQKTELNYTQDAEEEKTLGSSGLRLIKFCTSTFIFSIHMLINLAVFWTNGFEQRDISSFIM